MTSVNGYYVVSAPCCQRKYRSLVYSSINTRNWHRWSDGFAFGDLYKPTSKICRCGCGAYFFADDVETLEYVRFKDAPDQGPSPLPRLSWSDCSEVMGNGQTFCNDAIECEIRLLYWRCLNHRYRKRADQDEYAAIFADLNVGPPRPIPFSQLTDAECDRRITENLEVLYPLIVRYYPDDQLLLGETCRQAGRMNDAIEHYKQVHDSDEAAAEHLTELANAKSTRVIRIEPPDWMEPQQKPEPWRQPFSQTKHQEIQSRDYWFKI